MALNGHQDHLAIQPNRTFYLPNVFVCVDDTNFALGINSSSGQEPWSGGYGKRLLF